MCVINRELFFNIFGSGAIDGALPIFTGYDIEPLIAFSRTFQPKTIIEIGIQRGETAKCILDNSPWIEKYIGIDVTTDYHTPLSIQQPEIPQIAGEYVKEDPRVELIIKPNGSRDLTPSDLPEADMVFIDGDHSSNGVLLDTQLARKVVRHGGIICWHDYGNHLVPGVSEIINSLNVKEGNQICLIENGSLCFQFWREKR